MQSNFGMHSTLKTLHDWNILMKYLYYRYIHHSRYMYFTLGSYWPYRCAHNRWKNSLPKSSQYTNTWSVCILPSCSSRICWESLYGARCGSCWFWQWYGIWLKNCYALWNWAFDNIRLFFLWKIDCGLHCCGQC